MDWKERAEYMKKRKAEIKLEEAKKAFEKEAKINSQRELNQIRRANLIFNYNEINSILRYVDEHEQLLIDQEIIDQEIIDSYGSKYEFLLGFKFEIECIGGDHRNDGQLVDYRITITNPKGESFSFDTEMCLMVGWNVSGSYNLKEMKYGK